MSDLVRTSSSGGQGDGSRPRVFIVREPAKSVRPGDAPNSLPLHLALGVIVGLGTMIGAWLIGTIGTRLGFAPLMHLPALEMNFADGLLTAILIVTALPGAIIRTGVEHPLLMMIGYALIAVPAGCLAGVRAVTPGGPKPHPLSMIFANTVVILFALQACTLVWWVVSSFRAELIAPLPFESAAVTEWFTSMRIAAGLDVLAVIIAGLWVVLIMRVAIPVWLRALCAPAAIIALVIVAIAMSMTTATVAHVQVPRAIVADADGASVRLMIGCVGGHSAMMGLVEDRIVLELESLAATPRVKGRQSIIEFFSSQ